MKKHIPNFLTLCNLACGCVSVVFAFEGKLEGSAWMIGIAGAFDFLDGFAARILKAHSAIGKQLDSLADMISFGLAPGIIMYQCMTRGITFSAFMGYPSEWVHTYRMISQFPVSLAYISFLITICSALRLAKFNIDDRQTDGFIGMPTPANALAIASFPMIMNYTLLDYSPEAVAIFSNPLLLSVIAVISALLLVSNIKLFSLKVKSFKWEDIRIQVIFLGIAAILLLLLEFVAVPVIVFFYIVLSIIDNIRKKKSQLT